MANITINEVSQNYSYNIGNNSYATVALPITSCWGPGYVSDCSYYDETGEPTLPQLDEDALESVMWNRFPATQAGLESFISTYRGPAAKYRSLNDNSYQMAMTLLTSGYDVLVCRVATGTQASGTFSFTDAAVTADEGDTEEPSAPTITETSKLVIKAKYTGSFGNNLRILLQYFPTYKRWNIITYILDESGLQTAVENKSFVFDIDNSTDTLPHISELESNFIEIDYCSVYTDNVNLLGKNEAGELEVVGASETILTGGDDWMASQANDINLKTAYKYAEFRYNPEGDEEFNCAYLDVINNLVADATDLDPAFTSKIMIKQWLYTSTYQVLDTLKDKLSYRPQRIIVPGWDDQNFLEIDENWISTDAYWQTLSPLHVKLMEVAYYSRCATAYLDIPKALKRKQVYNENEDSNLWGYAQKLANYTQQSVMRDINIGYFSSHSALFAPWGKYTYAGTAKQMEASPSFLALMIERAMILNQPSQYEWQLPTNRKHNLRIGKLDYNISKKYLDMWQKTEGVGINCITNIPDMGISIWGNSTLFSVPPATYQALANLSTRKLVNAIEDLAYKCGISITFQYNNDQAYNAFYAGMQPLLDTMKNQGAITDSYIRMSEDIDGLDQVNVNSVVGTIYITVNGVVNDISIDLVALPPNVDLGQYRV